MTINVIPFSLKDSPSLIEYVFPVQKLSSESYKEQMAVHGKTLTALGSYWKGRKPLILNRACILASLMPATNDLKRDLEIFEQLMGMDFQSLKKRLKLKSDEQLPVLPYKELISTAKRCEELPVSLNDHIWTNVNNHLGTNAFNFPDLIEQLGLMRFGRRPVIADCFSGSGQIPFAAAQLGCDVQASDLNPIACLLSWGAFNIVGGSAVRLNEIEIAQKRLISEVKNKIDNLGVESDGNGWRGKVYLYCLEVICPSSGWRVPVLPTLVVSKGKSVIAKLIPDEKNKRYEISLSSNPTSQEMTNAEVGTYVDGSVTHKVNGIVHSNKISSIRGDFTEIQNGKKINKNKLRMWGIEDFTFTPEDIYQERLYAIQWIKDDGASRPDTEFRSVTQDDLDRESVVFDYVKANLDSWQKKGIIPSMRIESGYNTDQPIRERGWTYWHHLFNPRQLMLAAFIKESSTVYSIPSLFQVLNVNSRLSRWNNSGGGGGIVKGVFDNQALNTMLNYGVRGLSYCYDFLNPSYKKAHLPEYSNIQLSNKPANEINEVSDIYITDPPYGDAVKYEEIYEFFISWLKVNPPEEFKNWTWDSRRAVAIKGEDHDFKLSMVSAYKKMAESMPDNGLQVVMFTHQSGSIWADMANIVWASGLKVSVAWYIVTETDSALRDGQYVKGTILLILRKRTDKLESFRDELAYEIKEEVKTQVELLAGLNSNVRDLYRDENLFEDADIQMAGYAAALRVLTKYSIIDGVEMAKEALRPRVKDQKTLVDDLIEFAVDIANQYLVPEGLSKEIWDSLEGSERFYLKMLDMECKGIYTLSNYQNFAKAFKVNDFSALIGDTKANKTQLKTAEIFGKRGMSTSDEFGSTNIRNILYGIYLLIEEKVSSDDVLHQLKELVQDFYRKRDLLIAIADYISKKTSGVRETESQSARILRDLIRNERI